MIVTKPIKWPVLFGEMGRLTGHAGPASAARADVLGGMQKGGDMDENEYEQYNLIDSTMLDTLLEVLDEETLAPMLVTFKQNMSNYIDDLEGLAHQENLEQSKRTAHALKGLSAQFGATRVSSMAKAIEESITAVADVKSLLPLLRRSIEETITVLDGRP